jgi:hypothetical protein
MTSSRGMDLQHLTAANASAGFNRLAEFEVIAAGDGAAALKPRSRIWPSTTP